MSNEKPVQRQIAEWNPMFFGVEPGKHVESRVIEFTKGNQRWCAFRLFVPYQLKSGEEAGKWVPGAQYNAKPQVIQELVQRINEIIATVLPEMGGQFVFQPGPMVAPLPAPRTAPQQFQQQQAQQFVQQPHPQQPAVVTPAGHMLPPGLTPDQIAAWYGQMMVPPPAPQAHPGYAQQPTAPQGHPQQMQMPMAPQPQQAPAQTGGGYIPPNNNGGGYTPY